jgi:hypothetical protein
MRRLLLSLAAGLFTTLAHAAQLLVAIDIDCDNVPASARLNEIFRAELGKIPDVVLLNNHIDLDLYIHAIMLPSGRLIYSLSVGDHYSKWSRISRSVVTTLGTEEMKRLRESLHQNGVTGACDIGYTDIVYTTLAGLREMVAAEVTQINMKDFEKVRDAEAEFVKWEASEPRSTPAP